MVDARSEGYLRRLEGVVSREYDVEEEYPILVGGIFRSHDTGYPCEVVVFIDRSS